MRLTGGALRRLEEITPAGNDGAARCHLDRRAAARPGRRHHHRRAGCRSPTRDAFRPALALTCDARLGLIPRHPGSQGIHEIEICPTGLTKKKASGGIARDRQDDRLCRLDRAGRAHRRLRAVQYSVGLDGPDPAWSATICSSRNSPTATAAIRCRSDCRCFPGGSTAVSLRRSAAMSSCSNCRPTTRPTTSSGSSACPAITSR